METVFSGIQPSGELHLGNYLGAVRSWVALQQQYRCFYCIVDYHAITQPYEPAEMAARARAMAIDLLACGVDPERATLFVQSAVPEHTELAWALASVTPFGELGRMTQFKDKSEHQPDNINAGIFMYPVLQTADILLYGATRVPVGEDQRQHLELAREIVRRFNARFGDTFAEPQPLFSTTPKILGLDGQAKMSKSLGNTIGITESPESIYGKLMSVSDRLMLDWFDALSAGEWSDLQEALARLAGEGGDPHAFKHALARRIVERFHGAQGAAQAAEHFRRTVQEREVPADLPETALALGDGGVLGLLEILERTGITPSRGEARRLVGQGAVTIDGAPVADPALRLPAGAYLIKVGKRRFARVRLR
jgi:tryptophanyl-tRNA synthetase